MMIRYLLYLIIIVIVILLAMKIDDEKKILMVFGIVGMSIGICVCLVGYILKLIIERRVNFINISKISGLIFNKFLMIGFISFLIGILCLLLRIIIGIIYRKDDRKKELINNSSI